MKWFMKSMKLREGKYIIIILIFSILISVPYLIRISKISAMYMDSSVRQGVLASTMYLESARGILLSSTLHITEVSATNGVIRTEFSYLYPSHIKKCDSKSIVTYYDIS